MIAITYPDFWFDRFGDNDAPLNEYDHRGFTRWATTELPIWLSLIAGCSDSLVRSIIRRQISILEIKPKC